MTNDLEDSGQWRSTVDSRLGTLETRVKEEARLRAAMDEDLTSLHVTRDLLQSLHDTQSDHTGRLTKLETGQEELKTRLERVEGRLGVVEGTLQKVHVGVQLVHDKLDRLIDTK
jgi:predicted nuclease with TOPRIM domain